MTIYRTTRSDTPKMVKVWDPFVRLFHWSLVGLFTLAYLSGDRWDDLHETVGYVIIGLLLGRIVWGFFGSRYARFSSFIYRPAAVLGFLRDSLQLKGKRYLGHNPAGGAMVVSLIVVILVICASGVMMGMDAFWGEQWVEDLHKAATWTALGLVALHLVGVLLASVEHRENLVKSMLTGFKRQG